MNPELRLAIRNAIAAEPVAPNVIQDLHLASDGTGFVRYAATGTWIDPSAPGFNDYRTIVSDEELVRAYLLVRLISTYSYPARPTILELERVYKAVGRPGKGGRIDVVVRSPPRPRQKPPGRAFLFIECKAPDKFDADLKLIDGQLFRLSRQESLRPKYLVYYTVDLKGGSLRERLILVDTDTFPNFEDWNEAGQPITDAIPAGYGKAIKRRYANVVEQTETFQPLDTSASEETFNRLRSELHDVIWGGGGTNNNEVFVLITRLILCKIYDEQETAPAQQFRFQRLGDAVAPELAASLVARLNALYREAEDSYLALPKPSEGPAFDTSRISEDKIAYVVGRLEGLSVTQNVHSGDLLGEFFEQIVSSDFTQTKGQFFTPVKIVRFMLDLAGAPKLAKEVMLQSKDHLGRPRLPYVIDPACGSGTFLIEYMKLIRNEVGSPTVRSTLPARIRQAHETWFSGSTGNSWAREFLFGVENNYDLGLAAKVNMVLHGDGSMNTWIRSALDPFSEYWVEERNNVLGVEQGSSVHPYGAGRNEQFDFVVSNPPFSLRLSPDEKSRASEAFQVMATASSEAVFIERWYQLLREGGQFCCVLPEAILDTSSSKTMRWFLLSHFRVLAVVSLPYDAFRPFTSTKTSIVFASKRSRNEIAMLYEAVEESGGKASLIPSPSVLGKALASLEWHDDPIFMAEPASIGYKRRKGLPDVPLRNDLYRENSAAIGGDAVLSVLDSWAAGRGRPNDPLLGFTTTLGAVAARSGFRLDPKYRWLWDFDDGVAWGDRESAVRLSSLVELAPLDKVTKGELPTEATVIDLVYVESRQAIVREDAPKVDEIASDRVSFRGADLAVSKLEPYLGKVIIAPDPMALGSTEWVGLRMRNNVPPILIAYLLMLPQMCEAARRLQSGKRHARLDPIELLTLGLQVPPESAWPDLLAEIMTKRTSALELRAREKALRAAIDVLLGS